MLEDFGAEDGICRLAPHGYRTSICETIRSSGTSVSVGKVRAEVVSAAFAQHCLVGSTAAPDVDQAAKQPILWESVEESLLLIPRAETPRMDPTASQATPEPAADAVLLLHSVAAYSHQTSH